MTISLLQVTSTWTSMFVVMSHNVTTMTPDGEAVPDHPMFVSYTTGLKDIALVFFYTLICIVMHAVVQEYVLDKLNRRLHLSKVKHSKFNESGQLLVFYLVSVIWGAEILRRESWLSSLPSLWVGYPHLNMSYMFKFYFIVQLSYWLHSFPELYFQKTKKDEMSSKMTYSSIYFVMWTVAYVCHLNRIALCLALIHYFVEGLFHASRLFYFADKGRVADGGFRIWNIVFVLARFGSLTLSVLTFWFGLAQSSRPDLSISEGNFNTPVVRLNLLAAVSLLQAWMMWNFINFHLKRSREKAAEIQASKRKQAKKLAENKKKDEGMNGDVHEVEQNKSKKSKAKTH